MDHKVVFKEVKEIIEDRGAAFVAYKLGYKTSQTIEMWLRRKRIPRWFLNRHEMLIKELKEEGTAA